MKNLDILDGDIMEERLDDFDVSVRSKTLADLVEGTAGICEKESDSSAINCHAHTFYSYNAYGYSPSHFAWLAKQRGLEVAGIVDFDVLDGLEEFMEACERLKLKGCVSLESRTFLPEFSERVINSPGEPGVAYHMGIGFTTTSIPAEASEFLGEMRKSSDERNRGLLERVNAFMKPVELDYEKDVQSLTPAGNATERHICLAYARKAMEVFPAAEDLAAFWSEKLGVESGELDLPDGGKLQALIRSKTMKRGGVGYVQPGAGSFPAMSAMNRFVLEAGAIPALTWLDGTSEGEQAIDELIEVSMKSGVAAINIIPDRNFTAGVMDDKLTNLYEIVEKAEALGLPVLVGTEMNSPGLKFVDDFGVAELKPLLPVFRKGAYIIYAHTVLQSHAGMGYLSEWADAAFADVNEKNDFYEKFGSLFMPGMNSLLDGVNKDSASDEILTRLSSES
jgi:hypothetical protein